MFKRITALAMCLVLAASLLPAASAFGREPIAPETVDQCCHTLRVDPLDPNYVRPAYEGKLIELTPQRVQDTFDYLDAHYVKNQPEQALMTYTGTAEDQANLLKLAETITEGCKTNREKADAIGKWLNGNINYDVDTSAYASDTFYRREGNCLSYANLMMFLLRSLGIPAVVGDGWRGDMKESTVDLFNYEGHAWVFVLLDGEWVLYDPLWIEGGTTDRDYMAEWIYFDTVEFITPASDGDDLPPVPYDKPVVYCTDGKYYMYSDDSPQGVGTLSAFVNNQAYIFVTNQCDGDISDGRYYMDGRDKSAMTRGEVYRDGWVSYGDYSQNEAMNMAYAFPNGMMPDGYVLELDGRDMFMSYDTAKPILAAEEDYWIENGRMTVCPGYSGPFLGVSWQDGCLDSRYEYVVSWESWNPDTVTVDQGGNITCHQEGFADLWIELQRVEHNGELTLMASDLMTVLVREKDRTPDYRDLSSHTHTLVFSHTTEPTCDDWGLEVYKCQSCSYTEERLAAAPLGHDYVRSVLTEPTCTGEGISNYECSRCHDSYTSVDIPALGHDWDGTSCIRCDQTRMTPFDDVAEGSFYETPVAWAVEQGITNGISANEFGSLAACNRAQVVTFLWRAAGCPEPERSENPFVDVAAGSFYEKAVLWAVEKGVTNGTDATHFGPNEPCNRASVVTFLWRAAGKPSPTGSNLPFTDVPAGSWYAAPVLWAMENGITNGISASEFGATAACNRAQVVTFLYRAFAK